MDINSIDFQLPSLQSIQMEPVGVKQNVDKAQDFEGFYQNALGMWNETNQLQKEAEHMSLEFAAGRLDNFAAVTIAQTKATIALEYTVLIRNQILDAYREIMRMQL